MFGYSTLPRNSYAYPQALCVMGRHAPKILSLYGNPAALSQQLIGLLCSRALPEELRERVRDWALAARDLRFAVIGGFLSEPEREVLEILLQGTQPVVVCLARGLKSTHIPSTWRTPIERGRLLLVSPFADDLRHITRATAEYRNRMVAALAQRLVVPHASPGGSVLALAGRAIREGVPVHAFDHPANRPLLRVGARF
jgi:predicted Rossmann fold nucleotide-binding protein DprA/Smf involved in DNA uptake